MEPDTVSTPKINRNTFKIGSGDLQQQVASNTKRIRVISTMLKSSRRGRSTEGLTPQATNIQQSLEQSNLILADIAIQLQQDFDSREQIQNRLLQKNREDQLELRRRNKEEDIEYQKSEKKITKSTKKIKGPLDGLFKTIGKILLLFGGLVLIKTLLKPGVVDGILNSQKFEQAKTVLDVVFKKLTDGMKLIVAVGGVLLGMKLVKTLATILAVGKGFLVLLANPFILAGIGLLYAASMQGLGKTEKDVIKELENMGGFSKENRQKLIERLEAEKEKMNITNLTGKAEADRKIRFLETGGYGYDFSGKPTKTFDFSNIDQLTKLDDFDKFLLSLDNDVNVNDYKRNDNNAKITTINIEGETVDLTGGGKKGTLDASNNQSATTTPYIASVDDKNYKIKEFAEIAGFSDSVYG